MDGGLDCLVSLDIVVAATATRWAYRHHTQDDRPHHHHDNRHGQSQSHHHQLLICNIACNVAISVKSTEGGLVGWEG